MDSLSNGITLEETGQQINLDVHSVLLVTSHAAVTLDLQARLRASFTEGSFCLQQLAWCGGHG